METTEYTPEQAEAMQEDAARQLAEFMRHVDAVEAAGQTWLASR